ncbi:putative RNA helicase [Helianthus anomalus]
MAVFLSSLALPFTPPFNKRSYHPISVSVSSSSSPSTNQENPNFVPHRNVTLRDICQPHVPHHILRRVEEVGYLTPTEIQRQALPVLFSRRDCILHAQVIRA